MKNSIISKYFTFLTLLIAFQIFTIEGNNIKYILLYSYSYLTIYSCHYNSFILPFNDVLLFY